MDRNKIIILLFIFNSLFSIDVELKVLKKRPFLTFKSESGITVKKGIFKKNYKEFKITKNSKVKNLQIEAKDKNKIIEINSDIPPKYYYGKLIVNTIDNSFSVINKVSEEQYLESVVGSEMDDSFPIEALKAQCIISRTLLYYQLEKNKKVSDLSSEFQAYRGGNFSGEKVKQAVIETKGIILKYKGKLFYPFFHSTCGGIIFPENYLTGNTIKTLNTNFKFDYADGKLNCINSPFLDWEKIIYFKEIERIFGLRKLTKFEVEHLGNNFVKQIILHSPERVLKISGYEFVRKCWENGLKGLKSLNFQVSIYEKEIHIKGRGFGHGIGMCQWGARGLAEKGYKFNEILKFYFPGTTIQTNVK